LSLLTDESSLLNFNVSVIDKSFWVMLWLAFTGRITNANSKEIMVIIDKNLFILQTLLLLYKIAFYVDKPHLLTGIKSPTFQNQLLYIIYKNQLAKICFISISSSDKLILSNYISNVNTKDNYFLYCAFNMQCLLTHLYFLRNLCSTNGTSRPTNRISSQAAFFSIYKIFEKSRRHMHNGL